MAGSSASNAVIRITVVPKGGRTKRWEMVIKGAEWSGPLPHWQRQGNSLSITLGIKKTNHLPSPAFPPCSITLKDLKHRKESSAALRSDSLIFPSADVRFIFLRASIPFWMWLCDNSFHLKTLPGCLPVPGTGAGANRAPRGLCIMTS